MGYVFRDSVLVRFREVRFERVCFGIRFGRGRFGRCVLGQGFVGYTFRDSFLGAKIRGEHFEEVCFGLRVRRERFSGLLFWSGFVRYVLRRCISG